MKSMSTFVVCVVVLLILIALGGLGSGGWLLYKAIQLMQVSREDAAGGVVLIAIGMIPMILGTIALSGIGIIFAVDQARTDRLRAG